MKKWNCACDLSFLRLAYFPLKIVTWSIMSIKSFPRFPFTNMAEGCNSGEQGNPIVYLLFGSICLKKLICEGKSKLSKGRSDRNKRKRNTSITRSMTLYPKITARITNFCYLVGLIRVSISLNSSIWNIMDKSCLISAAL